MNLGRFTAQRVKNLQSPVRNENIYAHWIAENTPYHDVHFSDHVVGHQLAYKRLIQLADPIE